MVETPAEAGRRIATIWPPPTDEQIDEAARIVAGWIREQAERSAA